MLPKIIFSERLICPDCGYQIDKGAPRAASHQSGALLVLFEGRLIKPGEQLLAVMRANTYMWSEITKAQELVRRVRSELKRRAH